MSEYKVATGHNVALVSLNLLVPQPQGGAVMPVQRNPSASGVIHEQGLWARLRWEYIPSAAAYVALLTQFGLHNALTANVTVYLRNELYANARYNAIAVRPEMGADINWDNYRPRDVSILLKNLVAL